MQHLRNVYMWHFMDPFGFFGKPFDAMQHPAVCNDVDTDGWHSVQSSYTRKWDILCMCDMKDTSEFDSTDGIVRIIRTQLVGANHMQATNVQDAVLFTLAGQRTKPKYKCHQHLHRVARSTCVGMYTNTLVKLRLGPIVVVAVEAQSSYLAPRCDTHHRGWQAHVFSHWHGAPVPWPLRRSFLVCSGQFMVRLQ